MDVDKKAKPLSLRLPSIKNDHPTKLHTVQEKSLNSSETTLRACLSGIRRKMDYSISYNGKPHQEDLAELSKEIMNSMANILQPNDRKQAWINLNQLLEAIIPYQLYISDSMFYQYIERVVYRYQARKNLLSDVPILVSLRVVFPESTASAEMKYKKDMSTEGMAGSSQAASSKQAAQRTKTIQKSLQRQSLNLPNGANPYQLKRPDDDPLIHFGNKPLTLNNLQQVFGNVAHETRVVDSINKCSTYSSAALAMSVQLPVKKEQILKSESFDDTMPEFWKDARERPNEDKEEQTPKKLSEIDYLSLNGLQAVELFLKHRHLGKSRFIYLNHASLTKYRPYDLMSVRREYVYSEHFVFSAFGVLHVLPGEGDSESLTLAEWHRQASLWNVVGKIPFFSHFLLKRTIRRWKANTRYAVFLKSRRLIALQIVTGIPVFRNAMIQLFSLTNELSTIKFLPVRSRDTKVYSLVAMKKDVHFSQLDSSKYIRSFFRCCNKIIEVAQQSCHKQLLHCQEQVNLSNSSTGGSLYLQRLKRQHREKKLKEAQETCTRLTSFFSLINKIISCSLVGIARDAVNDFVYGFLTKTKSTSHENEEENCEQEDKKDQQTAADSNADEFPESNFFAEIRFNNYTHKLEMIPSITEFRSEVIKAVDVLIRYLSEREEMEEHHSGTSSNFPVLISGEDSGTLGMDLLPSSNSSNPSNPGVGRLPSHENFEAIGVNDKEEEINDAFDLGKDIEIEEAGANFASKSRDDMGVATPTAVNVDARLGLRVEGRGIMLENQPKDREKLWNMIRSDSHIAAALVERDRMLNDMVAAVTHFCSEANSWMKDVRKFTQKWKTKKRNLNKPAIEREVLVMRVNEWIDKLKKFQPYVVSKDNVLVGHCAEIHAEMLPDLIEIEEEIKESVTSQTSDMMKETLEEMNRVIGILSTKPSEINLFASFAKQLSTSSKRKEELVGKTKQIRSLLDMIMKAYRPLTPSESKQFGLVESVWNTFLQKLSEAEEFIMVHKPVVLEQMDSQFEMGEKKAKGMISTGMVLALDPESDPKQVMEKLKENSEKLSKIVEELSSLNEIKQNIFGSKYNLIPVEDASRKFDCRIKLWQMIAHSKEVIKQWKRTAIKKFDPDSAIETLFEWQKVADELGKSLPPGDNVVAHWCEVIEDVLLDLPPLCQISSDAMHIRHWNMVYMELGISDDENRGELTVDQLLQCGLFKSSKPINTIYKNACSEYTLEKKLISLKKMWDERRYQLAKHIYVVRTRNDNAAIGEAGFIEEDIDSKTYVLVDVEQILDQIADSHIFLHFMLHSNYGSDVRPIAKVWDDTLHQINEIITIWQSCQNKWVYLNRVFNGDPYLASRLISFHEQFNVIDSLYRKFMATVSEDPKVLSVLSRLVGQRGWRELQGEPLRKHLQQCLLLEEKILSEISGVLDEFRTNFPRLFFLSDDSCIRLLGLARHPHALIPYVRECFPAVTSVEYGMPTSSTNRKDMNLGINAHKLVATHFVGNFGETLPIDPVKPNSDVTMWLKKLETNMRASIEKLLKQAIAENLHHHTHTHDLMEEVYDVKDEDYEDTDFDNWLIRYPSQVVLFCKDALFYRNLKRLLSSGAKAREYESVNKQLLQSLHSLSQIQQELIAMNSTKMFVKRVSNLLSAITVQTCYHRDVLLRIRDLAQRSLSSYEWQSLIKPSAEIVDYQPLKLKPKPATNKLADHNEQDGTISRSVAVEKCYIEHMGETDHYGYEFQTLPKSSNSNTTFCSGVVITPMTERCMFGTIVSLRAGLSVGITGVPGVGKTVTTRELARIYGRSLFDFDCTRGTSMKILNKCLIGAVETGSWFCFSQPELLPLQTLSILAQNINSILHSYKLIRARPKTTYMTRAHIGNKKPKRSPSLLALRACNVDNMELQLSDLKDNVQAGFHTDAGCAADFVARPQYHDTVEEGCILFNGDLIHCKDGFGFIFNFSTEQGCLPKLPDNMRCTLRPVCLLQPNLEKLVEVWMYAGGFTDVTRLSKKLTLVFNSILTHASMFEYFDVSRQPGKEFPTLRSVVRVASRILARSRRDREATQDEHQQSAKSPPDHKRHASVTSSVSSGGFSRTSSKRSENVLLSHLEEQALADATLVCFTPKFGSGEPIIRITETIRSVFSTIPSLTLIRNQHKKLERAIQDQLAADGHASSLKWVDKACQLFSLLEASQSVIITGQSGSGKTTLYSTLSKAFNSLSLEALTEKTLEKQNPNKSSAQFASSMMKITSTGNYTEKEDFVRKLASSAATKNNVSKVTLGALSEKFNILDEDPNDLKVLRGLDANINVDISVIFPNAHTVEELYGSFQGAEKRWKNGILSCFLQSTEVRNDKKRPVVSALQRMQTSSKPTAETKPPSVNNLQRWIVLDGEVSQHWIDRVICSLHGHASFKLDNMGRLEFPSSSSIIFETSNITAASPAIIAQCAVLHIETPHTWKLICDGWIEAARGKFTVDRMLIRTWADMLYELVPPLIDFLSGSGLLPCNGIMQHEQKFNRVCSGVHEMNSFISIFTGCMAKIKLLRIEVGKEDAKPKEKDDAKGNKKKSKACAVRSKQNLLKHPLPRQTVSKTAVEDHAVTAGDSRVLSTNLLIFSLVWSFGGSLENSQQEKFDTFLRKEVKNLRFIKVKLPPTDSVFDYYFDDQAAEFRKWSEMKLNDLQPKSFIIPGQTERYLAIAQLLLNSNQSVLLSGVPGCGKSSLVNNLLSPVIKLNKLHISPLLTPAQIQYVIESKASPTLQRHNLTLMAHPNTILAQIDNQERQSSLFFMEDLSYNGELPGEKLATNAPNLEFLRQLITTNAIHDHERLVYKSLERDLVFLATATTPGAAGSGFGFARQSLSPRLLRHFFVLRMQELTSTDMVRIYHEPVNSWLNEFPATSMLRNAEIAEALIQATYEVYGNVLQVLRVTPRKPHYMFTLHTVGHVLKGMFMMAPNMDAFSVRLHEKRNSIRRAARNSISTKRRVSRGGAKDLAKASPMTRSIVRLWLHECTRTFYDRIIDEHDQLLFNQLLEHQLVKNFCTGVDGELYQPEPNHEKNMIIRPSTGGEGHVDEDIVSTKCSSEEAETEMHDGNEEEDDKETDEGSEAGDDEKESVPHPSTGMEILDVDITNYSDKGRKLSFVTLEVEMKPSNNAIALIHRDEVLDPDEKVTDILMSYNLVRRNDHLAGMKYVESSGEELRRQFDHLLKHQKTAYDSPTKVTSRYLLHHLSRVSRLLATPDANHAILMSSNRFHGRRNIVRLLAQLNNITIVETTSSDLPCGDQQQDKNSQLRCFMKKAHRETGLQNQKVILLITRRYTENQDCLNDISSLINQGCYPKLYTPDELAELVSYNRTKFYKDMTMTGGRNVTMQLPKSKIEEYVDTFFKRVKTHLCIILLMDCPAWKDAEELSVVEETTGVYHNYQNHKQALAFSQRLRCTPNLFSSRLLVDYYPPWPHSYWKKIAEKVLIGKVGALTGGTKSSRHGPLLADKRATLDYTLLLDELDNLTHVMAYVHIDATSRTKMILDDPTDVVGPPSFFHMIELLMGIASRIYVDAKQTITRFGKVAKKIRQLRVEIDDFDEEKNYLIPQHQASIDAEVYWKQMLDDATKEYLEVKKRVSDGKKEMTDLERELTQVRRTSILATEEVTPMLNAAVETLRCLHYPALLEIKRYLSPPVGTVRLAEILCKMFGVEPISWETGHNLILREGFFAELEFYNKDNIPDHVFDALKHYCERPDFNPRFVEQGSRAAGGMCRWVHAIYQYNRSHRYLQPMLEQLRKKEQQLHNSQSQFGEKRVKCNQMKNNVESQQQAYQQSVFEKQKLDDKMKYLQENMTKANSVRDHMKNHTDDWLLNCNEAEQNCFTCFGDALLAAACCAYHGAINDQHRKHSIRHWVTICEYGRYNTDRDMLEFASSERPLTISSHYVEDHQRRTKPFRRTASSKQTLEEFLASKPISRTAFLETRVDFSLPDILSDTREQSRWLCSTHTADYKSRFDALRIVANSIYQQRLCTMLFDPDDRAQVWMKLIFRKIVDETVNEDLKRKALTRKSALTKDNIKAKLFPSKKKLKFARSDGYTESTQMLKRSPSWEDVVCVEETITTNLLRPRRKSDGSCTEIPKDFIKPIQSTRSLWIYDISHPDIFYILMSAKKHGACLMIEKAEKRLALARKFISGCYHNKSSSIGGVSSITHPSFRLFVSTSYDLEQTTREEREMFPLHMTTITNLTLSFSALHQRLESEILAIRWPSFEPHRQLLDKDKMHLLNKISQLKNNLLMRVSERDELTLLRDKVLLRIVTKCSEELSEIEEKLSETCELGKSMEKRKAELVEVPRYGRLLYHAIRITTPILPSLKGITPHVFISLYCNCLRKYFSNRGADLNNASSESAAGKLILQSQKAELFQVLTKMLVKKIEQMTGETDGRVCTLLLVLTTQIDRGQLTQNDFRDLLAVVEETDFVESRGTFSTIPDDYVYCNDHHPIWMNKSEWLQLLNLEKKRKTFTGINTSISKRPKEWKEYFDCETPFLSSVPEPFLQASLTRKDIAILWSVVRPSVFCRVIQDYCETEVGFMDVEAISDHLNDVLPLISPNIPCIIITNNDDGWDQLPSLQLSFLAMKQKAQLIERTLPFEEDIVEVVRDCAAKGHWLHISQYSDEVSAWPEKVVQMLHDIVHHEGQTDAGEKKLGKYDEESATLSSKNQQTNDASMKNATEDTRYDRVTQVKKRSFYCHKDFRLWISLRTEQRSDSLPLPFVLWRFSIFCTLRSTDSLLEKVKQSFNNLAQCRRMVALLGEPASSSTGKLRSRDVARTMRRVGVFLPFLHGILSQRSMHVEGGFHGNYVWSDSDMFAIVQSFRSSHAASVSYENARGFVRDLLSMSMVDHEDLELMHEISTKCFLTSEQIDNALQITSTMDDLPHLTKEAYKIAAISEKMDRVDTNVYQDIVPKPGSVFFGLHPGAPVPEFSKKSKILRARLRSCYERQRLKNGLAQIRGYNQSVLAEDVFNQVLATIAEYKRQILRSIVPTEGNYIGNPIMSRYFSDEVKRLRTILNLLVHDFDIISSAIKSDIEITPVIYEAIEDIFRNRICRVWLQQHSDSFQFHSEVNLHTFVTFLPWRARLLSNYIESFASQFYFDSKPKEGAIKKKGGAAKQRPFFSQVNLSVLTRPDLLFTSLTSLTARLEFGDPYKYHLQFELDKGENNLCERGEPNMTNWNNIYLSGMYLMNATCHQETFKVTKTQTTSSEVLPRIIVSVVKKNRRYISSQAVAGEDMFNCPVWIHSITEEKDEKVHIMPRNIIFTLPLESGKPNEIWQGSGVSISCLLRGVSRPRMPKNKKSV